MPNKFKSSAKVIPIEEAVGTVLGHDITEIRPGQFKGAAFKKGQIIREEDLEHLRRLGKEHLYVLSLEAGEVHEDEAALRLARVLTGPGVVYDEKPSEGKVALRASQNGLLKVNVDVLVELNMVPEVSCSSRHTNSLVEEGEIVAATRVIPLIMEESLLNTGVGILEEAGPIFSVEKLSRPKVGVIITGSEVYNGLIEDKFAPLITKKLRSFLCEPLEIVFAPDDMEMIVGGIRKLLDQGIGLLMVAGGMSVDPDDITRLAIAEAGAQDVVYGTPVLPGAMFLVGRFGDVPVLGLPACVLFYRTTVLDLILPRVLAGETLTRKDVAEMAHGGLCLDCEQCRFPVCPFGK